VKKGVSARASCPVFSMLHVAVSISCQCQRALGASRASSVFIAKGVGGSVGYIVGDVTHHGLYLLLSALPGVVCYVRPDVWGDGEQLALADGNGSL
jgi:hypothetical protein